MCCRFFPHYRLRIHLSGEKKSLNNCRIQALFLQKMGKVTHIQRLFDSLIIVALISDKQRNSGIMQLPTARTANLVEQETDKDLLIYDLQTDKAYMLNETSKFVFRACDGRTSFDNLKRRYKYTDDLIYLALDELKKSGLLEDNYISPFIGMSRREVVRRVGLASLTALPLITSLIAPQAAQAASACGGACTDSFSCPGGCPNCTGSGTCRVGTVSQPCNNIDGSCRVTSTCNKPPRQTFGSCTGGIGGSCTADRDCFANSTCTGTGTCTT